MRSTTPNAHAIPGEHHWRRQNAPANVGWRCERDALVHRLRHRGSTLEDIAIEVGLSRERVRRILQKPYRNPVRGETPESAPLELVDILVLRRHAETLSVLFPTEVAA